MKWLTQEQVTAAAASSKEDALKCAIKHWEQLCSATIQELRAAYDARQVALGGEYCALCQWIDLSSRSKSCRECYLGAKDLLCESAGSPWRKALHAFDQVRTSQPSKQDVAYWQTAAKNMLDILKSFLVAKPRRRNAAGKEGPHDRRKED